MYDATPNASGWGMRETENGVAKATEKMRWRWFRETRKQMRGNITHKVYSNNVNRVEEMKEVSVHVVSNDGTSCP